VLVCLAAASSTTASDTPATVPVTLRNSSLTVDASTIPVGPVIFVVRNRASVGRTFAIAGKTTAKIQPGKSATLSVSLGAAGLQEYSSAGRTRSSLLNGSVQVIQPCVNPVASTATVTLGQDQGGLTLSSSSVPCGAVTFVVTNVGKLVDDLHVFVDLPGEKGATPELNPGQTARLTITFTAKGRAYLESGDYPPAEPEFGGDFGEQGQLAIL
jgi:hypothetical protein